MFPRNAITAIALAFVLALTAGAGQQALAESLSTAFSANFLDDLFEYKADIDAKQLIPTQEVKDDIINRLQAHDYNIAYVEREFMGFNVSASDIRIHIAPSREDSDDDAKTRLSVDVKGRNVEINSKYFDRKYDMLDIDTVYGVYNAETDKVTIHVPYSTALELMFG